MSLDHVDVWIFDLDNTLYPADTALFPQIEARMTEYVMRLLAVERMAADRMRDEWWTRHGTTLSGLMAEHAIDPAAYLSEVHDIDMAPLRPAPDLAAAIAALPGRKLILTNGSRGHAENVAGKLGILHHFEDIFDIVEAGFLPKPERATYENFLAKHAVDPGRAAMFEDIEKNLLVPSALGMKTVLIPEENAKDLVEISDTIKKGLEIVPVTRMDEVLERALVRKPEPIEWDEASAKLAAETAAAEPAVDEDGSGLTAH